MSTQKTETATQETATPETATPETATTKPPTPGLPPAYRAFSFGSGWTCEGGNSSRKGYAVFFARESEETPEGKTPEMNLRVDSEEGEEHTVALHEVTRNERGDADTGKALFTGHFSSKRRALLAAAEASRRHGPMPPEGVLPGGRDIPETFEEADALFGGVALTFESYYNYRFSFSGVCAETGAHIRARLGGNAEDAYEQYVTAKTERFLAEGEHVFDSIEIESVCGVTLFEKKPSNW